MLDTDLSARAPPRTLLGRSTCTALYQTMHLAGEKEACSTLTF